MDADKKVDLFSRNFNSWGTFTDEIDTYELKN